jgi:hypothetical protein
VYILRGDDAFDGVSLRQGDILAGIPFPLMDSTRMRLLGTVAPVYNYAALPQISVTTHEYRADPDWVTIQVPVRFCSCAVLSNCCDLEARNGGRPQAVGVNLARLRPISGDIRNDAARFQSLRANKDPRTDDPGYIDYYYLEAHELLGNQDWRVHYSQVVTIPITEINLLLQKKIIQLDDRTRMKFKIKLAFTLGRSNEEEIQAGLENPWAEQAQDAQAAALPPAQAREI